MIGFIIRLCAAIVIGLIGFAAALGGLIAFGCFMIAVAFWLLATAGKRI